MLCTYPLGYEPVSLVTRPVYPSRVPIPCTPSRVAVLCVPVPCVPTPCVPILQIGQILIH